MSRLTRVGWYLLGTVLLVLAPSAKSSRTHAQQGPPGTKQQRLVKALQRAGVHLVNRDVNPGGTTAKTIQSFDFDGFIPLLMNLEPLRPAVGSLDVTVGGIRVVLPADGLAGGNARPGPRGGPATPGTAGGGVLLFLGNNNLVIAFAGNGGDGGHGRPRGGLLNGANGGAGGSVDIGCIDENSIVAISGHGGIGGSRAGISIAGIGTNGAGGNGGNSQVEFRMCNDITILAGDGGDGGERGNTIGVGGNGGDATAISSSAPNVGSVEPGHGGVLGGVNGTAPIPPPGLGTFPPSTDY